MGADPLFTGSAAYCEILAEIELPVIFITTYAEQLLTGAAPEPAFLITKPFRADTVRALISSGAIFPEKQPCSCQGQGSGMRAARGG